MIIENFMKYKDTCFSYALFPIWGDNFNLRFFAGAYAAPAPGAGYDPVRCDAGA